MELVGLNAEHATRYAHEFSGGQRQRIGIARALAVDPKFIVCDEPVSALDVSIQAQVINMFEDLQKKLGVAYLFIAHDLLVVHHISRASRSCTSATSSRPPRPTSSCPAPDPPLHRVASVRGAHPRPETARKKHRIVLEGDVPSPLKMPTGCPFRTRCRYATEQCAAECPQLTDRGNGSVDGACLAANSFVGLYTFDKDGKIQPALADGDPQVSDDGLTYTVTLKDGLKWSDGSALTAKDFEYSWKRAADPNTASDYAYLMVTYDDNGKLDPAASLFAAADDGSIDVKASDDGKTLTWKLQAPCSYMISLLAFPVFMPVPQAAVEAASDWKTNPGSWASEAGFVTSGAYTLKEWKHNESMVYVKNPNYYDAANVTMDELDFMLSCR
jgi:oligopeptide/dipeptide ABC transporter ATP-binding protein